ncbi:hypothetical protein MKW94_023233, partial [Papaver nudicaule]|nr:hypothetical protein [Papaver nudicaule]
MDSEDECNSDVETCYDDGDYSDGIAFEDDGDTELMPEDDSDDSDLRNPQKEEIYRVLKEEDLGNQQKEDIAN